MDKQLTETERKKNAISCHNNQCLCTVAGLEKLVYLPSTRTDYSGKLVSEEEGDGKIVLNGLSTLKTRNAGERTGWFAARGNNVVDDSQLRKAVYCLS